VLLLIQYWQSGEPALPIIGLFVSVAIFAASLACYRHAWKKNFSMPAQQAEIRRTARGHTAIAVLTGLLYLWSMHIDGLLPGFGYLLVAMFALLSSALATQHRPISVKY
jgi:hypothetical protein